MEVEKVGCVCRNGVREGRGPLFMEKHLPVRYKSRGVKYKLFSLSSSFEIVDARG